MSCHEFSNRYKTTKKYSTESAEESTPISPSVSDVLGRGLLGVVAVGVLGGPAPLVGAHVLHGARAGPAQLALGGVGGGPDRGRVTRAPAHQLGLDRQPARRLECLRMVCE